jgi:hypothetical protein
LAQSGQLSGCPHRAEGRIKCSEAGILDRFWLEFSAVILLAARSGDDEGIEVFGGAEGVHSQARR